MALPTDIATISAMQDPVLRNLLITQRYHYLSEALHGTIGGPNVNWSTFATWASKTAGLSIRDQEVPSFVAGLSQDDLPLLEPLRDTLGRVSQQIADGNRKVYAELAPLFAQFVTVFRDGRGAGQDELDAFVARLDPNPSSQPNGQAPLIPAFRAYYAARGTDDAVGRARLMLYGNCLIGLHEQTRLQPQIEDAMDAPVDEIDQLVDRHVKPGPHSGFLARIFGAVERPIEELAKKLWERIATRFLMSLSLPGGKTLPLGRDIPRAHAAPAFIPAPLADILDPAELKELLAQYDRARGDTDERTASVDWCQLEDRMNFIVNLFRSRQQDQALLEPPFTDAQRAVLETGKMPPGEL
jgi:hypothetical protein